MIISLAAKTKKAEPKGEDIKLKTDDEVVYAPEENDNDLKDEHQKVNTPLIQQAKKRTSSLFEAAERSLRLKKRAFSEDSEGYSAED